MVDAGMTHREIAEEVSRRTGTKISRSSVSAALFRAGEATNAKRYVEEIPWTVKEEHQTHYAARMLRLLGRRRKGIQNSAESDARLDAWLRQLERARAVVTYVPDTEDGFFYVQGEADIEGIPVMREIPVPS
jgi:hypothetical protein